MASSERARVRLTARIPQHGPGRTAVGCFVKAALEKTAKTFGRLDFALNNAGIEQPIMPAADIEEENWDRIVDIDFGGVFLCMKYENPLMLKQGGGAMMDRFSGGTPEGRARVIAQEPVGRMGKPEEIAAAVVWLCSDAAAFVVGHAMVIDGGHTV